MVNDDDLVYVGCYRLLQVISLTSRNVIVIFVASYIYFLISCEINHIVINTSSFKGKPLISPTHHAACSHRLLPDLITCIY